MHGYWVSYKPHHTYMVWLRLYLLFTNSTNQKRKCWLQLTDLAWVPVKDDKYKHILSCNRPIFDPQLERAHA